MKTPAILRGNMISLTHETQNILLEILSYEVRFSNFVEEHRVVQ